MVPVAHRWVFTGGREPDLRPVFVPNNQHKDRLGKGRIHIEEGGLSSGGLGRMFVFYGATDGHMIAVVFPGLVRSSGSGPFPRMPQERRQPASNVWDLMKYF